MNFLLCYETNCTAPAEKYALTVKVKYYMYQLCSDLQVFIKCSSAVADGGLVSGAPGRWKHRVPLPRWSPGALTDGVNEAKLVLVAGLYEVTKTLWSIHWKS